MIGFYAILKRTMCSNYFAAGYKFAKNDREFFAQEPLKTNHFKAFLAGRFITISIQ